MVAFVFYLLKLPQDLSTILANLSSTTACVVHILKQMFSDPTALLKTQNDEK